MKYWNNRKHEEVLKRSREKKSPKKRTPNYDTSCSVDNNPSDEIDTSVPTTYNNPKGFI